MNKRGFCIFINTVFQGRVPSCYDENEKSVVFATELEAQREIADLMMTRLQEFMAGHREFGDAIETEEYIEEVEVLPDGSVRVADEITRSVKIGVWLDSLEKSDLK